MADVEVPAALERLVEKMRAEYLDSEMAIADALAEAEGPLDVDALVEATGYTERTVKKRVDSLEERLGGEPLIRRPEADTVELHPRVVEAIHARG
ncbi:MAG: hypothetical protein ACLFMX_05825 [Halobacteriales archaeon]